MKTKDLSTAKPIIEHVSTDNLSSTLLFYLPNYYTDSASACCSHMPVGLPLRLTGLFTSVLRQVQRELTVIKFSDVEH